MRIRPNSTRRSGYVHLAGLVSVAAGGLALVTAVAGPGSAPPGTTTGRVSSAAPTLTPGLDVADQAKAALGLSDGTVFALDIDDTPGVPLEVLIAIDGQAFTLDLVPHSVRSDHYEVLAQVDGGQLVPMPPSPIRTLRGEVRELPGSVVAASRLDDGLHAMILHPQGDRHWIQPVAPHVEGAAENLHIVYHDDDVLETGATCGVNEKWLADQPVGEPIGGGGGAGGGPCGGDPAVAEIAFDADFEFYTAWGSSVINVENRINAIINIVNLQYTTEVGIGHAVATIIVRTTAADPYTATTLGGLLTQFRNHWLATMGGIQRDMAELFTGRNLSGGVIGVAFLNGVCNSNGYSVVENLGSTSCATDLSAHEMGHNWSADHCSCPGFTMNSSLTCANQFSPALTIPGIIAFRNTRVCLDCPCPEFDDGLEENDLCASAVAMPIGTTTNLVVEDVDEDWYELTLATMTNLTIDLTFTHAFGDVDIELYDGCGGPIVASGVTNTNDESISYPNFGATRDFFLRVFLDANVCNQYAMAVGVVLLNDDCADAGIVLAGVHTFTNVTANTDGPDEPASCNFSGDSHVQSDVWYRYFAQCTGQATVSLCGSGYDTKIAIYGANCPAGPGEVIACNNDFCGQQSEVTWDAIESTFYRIRVGGHFGAQGNGTMTITCTPEVLPCPEDVNGDGSINVLDLVDLLLCFGLPAVPGCEGEDVNGDGDVNVLDLVALLLLFGTDCP